MKDPSKSKRLPAQHRIDDATREAAWDELVRILIRGGTYRQAAELLGFHVTTIAKWTADERFKVKLRRTRSLIFQRTKDVVEEAVEKAEIDIQTTLQEYGREAIGKMRELMHTAEQERVQLKAAENLADRSPETQKTRKLQIGGGVMVFTPENMAVAIATAKEIRSNVALGQVVKAVPLDESMADPIIEAELDE
jgi:hypothetical protein